MKVELWLVPSAPQGSVTAPVAMSISRTRLPTFSGLAPAASGCGHRHRSHRARRPGRGHEHTDHPGFTSILGGIGHEHRGVAEAPIEHGPGSVASERDGVTHRWSNPSDEPLRALVVDLVP